MVAAGGKADALFSPPPNSERYSNYICVRILVLTGAP
jgi:hypothetical protein